MNGQCQHCEMGTSATMRMHPTLYQSPTLVRSLPFTLPTRSRPRSPIRRRVLLIPNDPDVARPRHRLGMLFEIHLHSNHDTCMRTDRTRQGGGTYAIALLNNLAAGDVSDIRSIRTGWRCAHARKTSWTAVREAVVLSDPADACERETLWPALSSADLEGVMNEQTRGQGWVGTYATSPRAGVEQWNIPATFPGVK